MRALHLLASVLLSGSAVFAVDWAAIRGVNFFTSTAANAHEMWSRMDAAGVDREIGWASSLGFNSLRLWLSVPAYEASPATFEKNLDLVLNAAAKRDLTAILTLFDNCGLPTRKDAVDMTVNDAYHGFLRNAALPDAEKQRIRKLYSEFAEGSGKDMMLRVGKDTPPDVLFWQQWSPNPGLEQMGSNDRKRMERYVGAIVRIARKHPNVIAFDLFNEPGVIFETPKGMSHKDANEVTTAFIDHMAGYLRKANASAPITIGSENVEQMKTLAKYQDVLSVHTYRMGSRLDETLREAKDAASSLGKPLLITECLANTDNWLDAKFAEESRSTDEAQLRHYEDNLPRFLNSGVGFYSWGFISGRMFTPFTDVLSVSGFRRPAAVYLANQLKKTAPSTPWPAEKALYEVNLDYYPGHSFRDLAADLPRLKDLGINVIYIMPFWECVSEQRYLITDYYKIDPRYGTPADLKQMVETAHRNGIRILLDLVTSLTYDGSKIVNEHPDFILLGDKGEKQKFFPFPTWGWALDCANPKVIEYYSKIARHYVEQFGIDGWRIDSPMNNYDPEKVSTDHSRLNLLRAVKAAVTEAKPNPLFVCEINGPTLMWGKDDDNETPAFDEICQASYHFNLWGFLGGKKESGFHYLFFDGSPAYGKLKMTPMDRVVHGQATSAEFVAAVRNEKLLFGAIRANFPDNHDTERVAYAFPERQRGLFVLAATLPGVPVVHAGQEIGTTNPGGHYERKPPVSNVIPWKEGNQELAAFYKKVLTIRQQNPALVSGDIRDALVSGTQVYSYIRSSKENNVLVVVNMGDKEAKARVSLPSASGSVRDLINGKSQRYQTKEMELELPPFGYRVMRIEH